MQKIGKILAETENITYICSVNKYRLNVNKINTMYDNFLHMYDAKTLEMPINTGHTAIAH